MPWDLLLARLASRLRMAQTADYLDSFITKPAVRTGFSRRKLNSYRGTQALARVGAILARTKPHPS